MSRVKFEQIYHIVGRDIWIIDQLDLMEYNYFVPLLWIEKIFHASIQYCNISLINRYRNILFDTGT